jgi:hypothetical protein
MSTRTADALADLLCDHAMTPGTAEADTQVRVLAWGGFAPDDLAAAWHAFRAAVQDREALATGERDWTSVDPDADGPAGALQRACTQVDDAYRTLAWGPAGGAQ